MAGLDDLLASYQPGSDGEAADVARLARVARRGDGWGRHLPLHATASALVVHPPTHRVLLRWHTKLDRWLQVGGHAEPGESDPWAIAVREATEETGLPDIGALEPDPGRRPVHIVIVPVPALGDEPAHEHADVRFLLVTGRPEAAVAESPGALVRWTPLSELEVLEDANLGETGRRVAAQLGRLGRPDRPGR